MVFPKEFWIKLFYIRWLSIGFNQLKTINWIIRFFNDRLIEISIICTYNIQSKYPKSVNYSVIREFLWRNMIIIVKTLSQGCTSFSSILLSAHLGDICDVKIMLSRVWHSKIQTKSENVYQISSELASQSRVTQRNAESEYFMLEIFFFIYWTNYNP